MTSPEMASATVTRCSVGRARAPQRRSTLAAGGVARLAPVVIGAQCWLHVQRGSP
jgi:hypothetical protein